MFWMATLLTATWGGVDYLENDGWKDGDQATFQGGFVPFECVASVFVPEAEDYPFVLKNVDLLFGGAYSSIQETLIVDFYEIDDTDMQDSSSWRRLGQEAAAITNSEELMSQVLVEDLEIVVSGEGGGALENYEIEEGNVAVSFCFEEEHSGYPGPANDNDAGNDYSSRNWIYADTGPNYKWYQASDLGVQGDWIIKLCIEGDNVAGSCNPDTDADTDADSDSDSDGDGDTDTDTDTDTDVGELGLQSITPDWASEGTPVDVVVLGSGFSSDAEVSIGGLSLTGTDVVNEQTITGRSPSALPVGIHDVEVDVGDDNVYLPEAFEVRATGEGETDGDCGCSAAAGPGTLAWLLALGLPLWRRRETGRPRISG